MSGLLKYMIKKVIMGIPIVFVVSLSIFLIMQAAPGDPIDLMLPPGARVSPERVEELRRKWGLDKPVYIQFFYWLFNIFRGNFGISIITKQPVSLLIIERLPYTLELTFTSLILSYIIGVPLGMIAAIKRGSVYDNLLMSISMFFYSMPTYWLGVMFMLMFSLRLGWFPISGYTGLRSLILPMLTLALPYVASVARLVRTEMIDVLTEDYVRTAWAKGLPPKVVLLKHGLRNALIPVTVMFFLQLPWLIGGAVVVETVFAWPGMGRLLYISILKQDFPVIQAIVFIITILTVISNTLGDIVLAFLDPRIRVEIEKGA